nr:unnamed protein product [Digitaria exilis]
MSAWVLIPGRPIAAAVNAVFAKLGQTASSSPLAWNISGDPCTGAATDGTVLDDNNNFNPGIKCDCSDQNNTVCHVTKLSFAIVPWGIDCYAVHPGLFWCFFRGFGSNYLNGSLPSELGNLAKLEQLYIDSAGLSGPLPSSFSRLTRMKNLWASDNDFTGRIPDYIGSWTNLTDL